MPGGYHPPSQFGNSDHRAIPNLHSISALGNLHDIAPRCLNLRRRGGDPDGRAATPRMQELRHHASAEER